MNARSLIVLFSLSACAPAALPPPKIISIAPSEMVACEGASVSVDVEVVLPTHVDYGHSEASVNPDIALRIGAIPVGSGKYVPGGLLNAAIPPVFAPGEYDVGLRVSDGRPEAILAGGFSVKPTSYPDGYTIDFIPDQIQSEPFAITIRAQGGNASAFNCTVAISSSRGPLSPTVSGRFQNGMRTEWITIDTPRTSVVITVRDDVGRSGSSNPFRVN
jgi:hypothetical protein